MNTAELVAKIADAHGVSKCKPSPSSTTSSRTFHDGVVPRRLRYGHASLTHQADFLNSRLNFASASRASGLLKHLSRCPWNRQQASPNTLVSFKVWTDEVS